MMKLIKINAFKLVFFVAILNLTFFALKQLQPITLLAPPITYGTDGSGLSNSCQNQCNCGTIEYQCSGDIVQKRECKDTNNDGCCEWTDWQNVKNCNSGDYDSDGGDKPTKYGEVIDYYCSFGTCYSKTYADTCSGICERSELTEYWLSGEKVNTTLYTNLFSNSLYCKNGEILVDKSNPLVWLSVEGKGWGNSDITVDIICNDNDESGCGWYNYRIEKIL